MNLGSLLNKIEIVSDRKNYWLVRTNKGILFEEYLNGNFIALGWDYLTSDQLTTLSKEEIKMKIAKNENLDITKTEDKIKITTSYNKLMTFLNLKKEDIVLIPSRNSDRIAFGKVVDNKIYEDKNKLEEGTFFKRRKIQWLEIKNIDDLNPIFYQIKSNQHSISNIDRFEPFINRVVENLYIKNDTTHFVLKIEKEDDINFQDLNTLMENVNFLIKKINDEFGFNENIDDFFIKISLQSKGSIEFIKGGKSLAILGLILSATACSTPNNGSSNTSAITSNTSIDDFINENATYIDSTNSIMDSLEVNREELAKIKNYGK